MADPIFAHPRLAGIYDALDPDRADLTMYLECAEQTGARRVLNVGCGTGIFALLLAARGIEVTAVDPAAASLDVAWAKPNAHRVHWIHGDARQIPRTAAGALPIDLATMTANVAQAIVAPGDWAATLDGIRGALRPGGRLVFETRDPAFRAWRGWNRADTYQVAEIAEVGAVQTWVELIEVRAPLVTFRHHWVFAADGRTLTSDSTLRFREREEVEADLLAHGYLLNGVREAPDRPGREFVFHATRQRTSTDL